MPSASHAEGKARQRARNKVAAERAGRKQTRSGSSGLDLATLDWHRKDWEEIKPQAVHVGDFRGVLHSAQITSAGSVTMHIGIPIDYALDATEMAIACRAGAVFLRVYSVPMDPSMAIDPGVEDGE